MGIGGRWKQSQYLKKRKKRLKLKKSRQILDREVLGVFTDEKRPPNFRFTFNGCFLLCLSVKERKIIIRRERDCRNSK